MRRSLSTTVTGLLVAGLTAGGLGALTVSSSSAEPAGGSLIIGLTDADALVQFRSTTPGTLIGPARPILAAGAALVGDVVGIDVRPATGELFALVNNFAGPDQLVVVDPATGFVSRTQNLSDSGATDDSGTFTALEGTSFGVDFNPVPDRLRVVSDTGQNLRINVDTGAVIVDGPVAFAAGGTDPDIAAAAYTNNFATPTATQGTTLVDIDFSRDAFAVQNPPNAGTLTQGNSLAPEATANAQIGFDIEAVSNIGFASLFQPNGTTRALFRVTNPAGGQVLTQLGTFATGQAVEDITVVSPRFRTARAAATVVEGQEFDFVVERTGDVAATATVTFATTEDGTTSPGARAVDFAAGAATSSVRLVVPRDGFTGQRAITFTLTGASGGAGSEALLVTRTTTFTVNDTDPAPATGAPTGPRPAPTTPGGATSSPSPSATSTATATATVTPRPTTTATPTVTPTGPTPSPTVACGNVVTRVNTPTIVVGQRGSVSVSGATPNTIIDLYAYSRPSTEYRLVRSAEAGSNGAASFDNLVPPTNTRLYGLQRGCPQPTNNAGSVVINVRTALGLSARRLGVRQYLFEGRLLPRNQATLVSLYRVDRNGREVLSGQDASDAGNSGLYQIRRTFTGSGRFNFVARTSQTLINAPGVSNVRPTIIF